MKMVEKLLKVRSAVKKRKPTYKRVQSHQFAKLSEVKWRRPKGLGNKVRRGRRGKPSMPQVGYKSPKLVRGLHKSGLREVIVNNLEDMKKINLKEQIAVIGAKVGAKKRLELLSYAKEKKISFVNIKDIDKAIEQNTKKKKEVKKKEIKKDSKPKTEESKPESKVAPSKDEKQGGKEKWNFLSKKN